MTWTILARSELTLLWRSPLAVVSAVVLPVAAGAGWLLLSDGSPMGVGPDTVAMQVLLLLGCTPYVGAVTMLAARRQELVLKRLRESALGAVGVWAGLLFPYALLGIVQTVLLTGMTMLSGGSPPDRWWPLIAAVVLGTVVAGALAVGTAVFTPAPELAQLTTVPVFVALMGGGLWLFAGHGWAHLLPGGALAALVRRSWEPGSAWGDVLVIVAITALALAFARWRFRWDPRAPTT